MSGLDGEARAPAAVNWPTHENAGNKEQTVRTHMQSILEKRRPSAQHTNSSVRQFRGS